MAKATCDCVEQMDEKLKPLNTRLGLTFHVRREAGKSRGEMVSLPMLVTEIVEKKRGARPKLVIPTFCPFCGRKYALETKPMPGVAASAS
jgi:hypothetical protein